MASIKDSFLDLERHRLHLEQNVAKIEKALAHWRRCDAEYEVLREQISPFTSPSELHSASSVVLQVNDRKPSSTSLERVKRMLQSDLIDDKEKDDIFGKTHLKTPEQVLNTLTHRLDYVGKNISTLESQLAEAQRKLDVATIVSDPGLENEEGLPFIEITEELDEDDNVINFELMRPGDKDRQLKEVIEKAARARGSHATEDKVAPVEEPANTGPPKQEADTKHQDTYSSTTRRFAFPPPVGLRSNSQAYSSMETVGPKVYRNSWDEVDDDGHVSGEIQITADDIADEFPGRGGSSGDPKETIYNPDQLDAHTREIVAIFQDLKDDVLSENESGDDDDEEWESYEEADEDDSGEEDDHGRSTKRVVTREYEDRMMEIKKRLALDWSGFRPSADDGEEDESDDDDDDDDDDDIKVGRIKIGKNSSLSPSPSFSSVSRSPPKKGILKPSPVASPVPLLSKKKSVRFSEELDIAPNKEPRRRKEAAKKKDPSPLAVGVVVRDEPPEPVKKADHGNGVSRFQEQVKGDAAARRGVPGISAMPHATMADLTVRDEVPTPVADPDAAADVAAITEAYHDKRRRMIQRHGGFAGDDDSPVQVVEADGTPKRVSRFKAGLGKFTAARLGELEENAM
jgi:unconventional prefoldin RPB5 interactor 1